MVCEQCNARPEGRAWGWLAFRIEAEDEAAAPQITFYCPRCSHYEFGEYLRYRLFKDGESPLR
jgi:hypothetical protein